jgi:16S rRNA (guanine966-N2)-methyltransferase
VHNKYHNQTLRIISGKWGSRRIYFADDARIRPSSDAVRETLFNWLADDIKNKHCLDLFAGSGSLGIEVLSRGGNSVTFVDISRKILASIADNLNILDTAGEHTCKFIKQDVLKFIRNSTDKFDLAFIDAPFHTAYLQQAADSLVEYEILAAGALVYVEHERQSEFVSPASWQLYKHQRKGGLVYELYKNTSPNIA